jgi:hypothetical protein
MDTRQLTEAIFEGGIRSNNFFNGRLLLGEDLTREQEANRAGHQTLGEAIGDGVVYGLQVTNADQPGSAPTVTVQSGLAVNRNGETLRLKAAVNVALVRPPQGSAIVPAGFVECQPLQPTSFVTGTGVYLLVLCPARGREGRAVVGGLNNGPSNCNTKLIVDGVQFRLIQLDLTGTQLNDEDHLQNLVAYGCFGAAETGALAGNLFGTQSGGYGLLDRLRPNRLTNCDVPLAVLSWTENGGLRFVDNWSARRRVIQESPTRDWRGILSDRRGAEAEAMFWQFAEQLNDLRAAAPESVVAAQHFRYLPPIGILPLAVDGVARGFNYEKFFEDRVYRSPVFIEGARLEALIRYAMSYRPIDLNQGVMIWLYLVRENRDERAYAPSPAPQDYVIFTSGHVPFHGEALFNVARWNYSNYS